MNILAEYVDYLKDNPEGYWFKRKLYGYGWIPARREGWLALAAYLSVVLGLTISADKGSVPAMDVLTPVIGATVLFIILVYRTGERPKWQWGRKKNSD